MIMKRTKIICDAGIYHYTLMSINLYNLFFINTNYTNFYENNGLHEFNELLSDNLDNLDNTLGYAESNHNY